MLGWEEDDSFGLNSLSATNCVILGTCMFFFNILFCIGI